jgi:hypothetical protein
MKQFFVFFLLYAVCGCGKHSVSEAIISSATSDVPVAESILPALESYRFVVLDASRTESLVGGMIWKIKKQEQGYYIACDFKRLIHFNRDGSFRYEINRVGGGPGEYTTLADFDVRGETLAVLAPQKINLHNSTDGTFIRTIPLDFTASNIEIVDDTHYLIYATGQAFYLIDDSGKIVNKYDRPDHLSRTYRQKPFNEYQNKLLVQIGYSNDLIVYDTNKRTFSEALLYDDDRMMTASEEDGFIRNYGNDYTQKVTVAMMDGLASSDSQLMFGRIDGGNDIKIYIADNQSNHIIHSLSEHTVDDLTYTSLLSWGTSLCDGGDSFITCLQPYEFLEGLEKNSSRADEEHYQWLVENIVPKLSEDGNPVLVEFSFKSK